MPRTAEIARQTKETDIKVAINLDGKGENKIDTGIGFFDHMLTALSKHSGIDMDIVCKGDLQVDAHHSVEDVGIVLGQAFNKAIGDKVGIRRYGSASIPMDEALGTASLDISGRAYLVYDCEFAYQIVYKRFHGYSVFTLSSRHQKCRRRYFDTGHAHHFPSGDHWRRRIVRRALLGD